ncbi:MAG: chemotaxis protein CheW [Treponemataceae bacterium]|nr:chemotaxis protein CheW [Treponemataceae bacterium]
MSNQFLTFKLDGAQYAADVHNVQEVLEYMQITKVPCTTSYMEGLINSRGQGISVVNLRKKFGMQPVEATKETRIIVMEVKGENDKTVTFGAIADSVQEVIELAGDEIEPSPKFGNSIAAQFIKGIGKKEDNFIIILNMDQIFSNEEIIRLEGTAANMAAQQPEVNAVAGSVLENL